MDFTSRSGLALGVAILVTGCSGASPATADGPTETIATEVLSATATRTLVPTEVPTPRATSDPIIWGIAHQMLADCAGAHSLLDDPSDLEPAYLQQLVTRVLQNHPEFERPGPSENELSVATAPFVMPDDGVSPSPFSLFDMPPETELIPEMTACEGYAIAFDLLNPENADQDGILAGEAWLFYEVGGTQPYMLDGELREIRFSFGGTEPSHSTPTSSTPSAWEIIDAMFSECSESYDTSVEDRRENVSQIVAYENSLSARVLREHPELGGTEWRWGTHRSVTFPGENPNPFNFVDLASGGSGDGTSWRPEWCGMYFLGYQDLPENDDGDGILIGEAYLYYEVDGSQPFILDGPIMEVQFSFPSASEQEVIVQARAAERRLAERVEAIASQDCLAVFPAEGEEWEIDAWFNSYLDDLFTQALGRDAPPEGYPDVFTLPLWDQPECLVLLYRDTASGDALLIYETRDGVVSVPFVAP